VVDDGSTDHTRSVVASFGDRVVYHYKKNGGQASALNIGFKEAKGRYCLILDADDYFYPDKVRKVIEKFEGEKNIGVVYNNFDVRDVGLNALRPNVCYCNREGDLRTQGILGYWPGVPTSGISLMRDLIADFKIPEEAFRISADYFIDAVMPLIANVGSIKEPLHAYVIHDANLYSTKMSRKDTEELHRRQIDFLYKYITGKFGLNPYYIIRELQYAKYCKSSLSVVKTYLNGIAALNRVQCKGKLKMFISASLYTFLPHWFYSKIIVWGKGRLS